MTDDKLHMIWHKMERQDVTTDSSSIDDILEKSVRSGWWSLRVNLWVFFGMLIVSATFHLLNLASSLHRPAWLGVHTLLLVITAAFFAVGGRVLRDLRDVEDLNQSLAHLIRRQLRFLHSTLDWWIWSWAFTIWMSSFCITVWVENLGDGFRVNHIAEYVAISAAMVFGSYALLRTGHYPMVQRSLAALHDLESQISEETPRIHAQRKYWLLGTATLVIALAIAVAWSCALWLSAAP